MRAMMAQGLLLRPLLLSPALLLLQGPCLPLPSSMPLALHALWLMARHAAVCPTAASAARPSRRS